MPPKKAPKKTAKPAPAATKKKQKPAPTKPAAKAAAKPAPKKAAPKKAKPAALVSSLREQLASAEAAAARVVVLEMQVVELTGLLDGANAERQSAMERLADLEERLAESAAAAPQASSHDDEERRVAAALAEKATAVRRAWELERDLESATADLERERAAHAEARARLSSNGGASPAPSAGDAQLRHRIAELESALADREDEVRRMLPPEAGGLITCPRCGGKMIEFEHLGVTLDRCTACAGLFFDSGELQEVLRREYPEAEGETDMVVVEMSTTDETPKKKGFFRSLFGRKE